MSARGEAGYRSGFRFQRPGVRIPPGGPYEKSRVNLVFMRLFSFCLEMGKARFRGAFPILLRLFLRPRG